MLLKTENPWSVESIYNFQYFICPLCIYKDVSKQSFVCHAFETHPESVNYLKNIKDGSLCDILCPWDSENYKNTSIINIVDNLKEEYEARPDDLQEFEYEDQLHQEIKIESLKVVSKFPEVSSSEFKEELNLDENSLPVLKNVKKRKKNLKKEENKEFKCYSCIKFFPCKQSFQQHISEFHSLEGEKTNEKTIKTGTDCDFCGKHFYGSVEKHIEAVHKPKLLRIKKDLKCDTCGKNYSSVIRLKQHIHTIHEDGPKHKCESCSKSFSSKKNLEKHVYIDHEEHKDFNCEYCGTSFKLLPTMKRHIAYNHEDKKEKCEFCGKSFVRAIELKKHIYTVHEGRKDYNCESCGKLFYTVNHLKKHIYTIHEGHKDYKCESCGKSFSHKHQLKTHITAVHEGKRDFKCKLCGKAFIDIANVNLHKKRIHDGVKKYVCETCGASFFEKAKLRDHTNIHTGEKPFVCKTCGKAFAGNGNLRMHERTTHEGYKRPARIKSGSGGKIE